MGESLTPSDRYQANLSALRTLAKLRDRLPIPEDLATLANYSGWADGRVRGFGFDSIGTCKPELRTVLEPLGITPESLITAGGLSAYFTPQPLAVAIWHLAVRILGRAPRAVLEPSAGMGVFLSVGSVPLSIAVEPDPIFAEILRYRFEGRKTDPWAIRQTTLERSGLIAPTFDLIVGNVPFGDWGVVDTDALPELRHKHLQSRVHDYFVCKCVSLLLPGGVTALITHASTMDRREKGVREWLAERVELVSMWRLPADLWESQGAGPVTDLIVVRKRWV